MLRDWVSGFSEVWVTDFACRYCQTVVSDVLAREKDGYLHGNGHGIIDQHEPLQRFVAFLAVR